VISTNDLRLFERTNGLGLAALFSYKLELDLLVTSQINGLNLLFLAVLLFFTLWQTRSELALKLLVANPEVLLSLTKSLLILVDDCRYNFFCLVPATAW
jgi:hypothetical protein